MNHKKFPQHCFQTTLRTNRELSLLARKAKCIKHLETGFDPLDPPCGKFRPFFNWHLPFIDSKYVNCDIRTRSTEEKY